MFDNYNNFIQAEMIEDLAKAIKYLDSNELLVLYGTIQGLRPEQIAERLGISGRTYFRIKRKALDILREKCK